MPTEIMVHSLVAGILASVACGLGVLPLLWPRIDAQRHTGIGYSFARGMMFAASVYNLIFPGLVGSNDILSLSQVAPVLAGMLLGAGFLSVSDRFLSHDHSRERPWQRLGNRATVLIFWQ